MRLGTKHPCLVTYAGEVGVHVCVCVRIARCRALSDALVTSLDESQLLWKGKLRLFLDQGQCCVYPHLFIHYLADRNETYTDR